MDILLSVPDSYISVCHCIQCANMELLSVFQMNSDSSEVVTAIRSCFTGCTVDFKLFRKTFDRNINDFCIVVREVDLLNVMTYIPAPLNILVQEIQRFIRMKEIRFNSLDCNVAIEEVVQNKNKIVKLKG